MDDTARKLAERIKNRFTAGIRIGNDVIHYMESVAGATAGQELFRQIEQEENCETESLYELIFYPDESDQIELEPLLEAKTVDANVIKEIEEYLTSKNPCTRLIFPEGAETPEISIPQDALSRYVRRLKLTRRLPETLEKTINTNIQNRHRALQVRVRLRNARFCFYENIVSFLCSMLGKMPPKSDEDMAGLSWLLGFMDQIDDKTDIYVALMEEKARAGEMLRLSNNSQRKLAGLPVEALIMQGVSIPCISEEKTVRLINTIDRIALAVFGQTETDALQSPVNLGVFNGRHDIDKIIKILS